MCRMTQRNKLNSTACARLCRAFLWRQFKGATALPVRLLLQVGVSRKGKLTVRSKVPCEWSFVSCMAFNVNEVVCVACQSRSWFVLYAPWETFSPFSRGVNISTTRQTSQAKDLVNAKGHAREKALLAG